MVNLLLFIYFCNFYLFRNTWRRKKLKRQTALENKIKVMYILTFTSVDSGQKDKSVWTERWKTFHYSVLISFVSFPGISTLPNFKMIYCLPMCCDYLQRPVHEIKNSRLTLSLHLLLDQASYWQVILSLIFYSIYVFAQ